MANKSQSNRSSGADKLSGWPRPRTYIAKKMGLNPVRMLLLIAMATAGLAGGYYIVKEVAPAPKSTESLEKPAPQKALTQRETYEEPLPENIIIERDGVLKRIALPGLDAEIDLGNGVFVAVDALQQDPVAVAETPEATELQPSTDDASKSDVTALLEKAELPTSKPQAPAVEQAKAAPASIKRIRALPDNIAELQQADAESLPAWQRYALPVTLSDKPLIVIVIDDVGLDRRRARQTIELPGPLTLSYMAYAEDLMQQTQKARAKGHELMLHVPMEPSSSSINPGLNVLLSGMPEDELLKNITWSLDQMTGYVGINNHMGSRFTSDRASMKIVVGALKARGYMFLDSVTSSKTVAHDIARQGGIPYAVRNVFLDHKDDLAAIKTQLRRTEQIAKRTGVAIAIGHPRDNTIEALREWLPDLNERGFQLVPISAVVRINKPSE